LLPHFQMGYGSRALSLLKLYYEGKIPNVEDDNTVEENIAPVEDEDVDLLEERIGEFLALKFVLSIVLRHLIGQF
jgi:hypothetical protein